MAKLIGVLMLNEVYCGLVIEAHQGWTGAQLVFQEINNHHY